MHTSLIMVALLGPGDPAPAVQTLTWQDSYHTARQLGRKQRKPVAVFIGNGPEGWKKVAEDGKLSDKAAGDLAAGYVCVYVDRTRPGGDKLAANFDIPSGPGLVLSSRDGEGQAFFHAGKLPAGDLDERIAKYASAEAVTRTEMILDPRVSFAYDPSAVSPAPAASPAPPTHNYASPSFGGSSFGGSSFGSGFSGGFGGGAANC